MYYGCIEKAAEFGVRQLTYYLPQCGIWDVAFRTVSHDCERTFSTDRHTIHTIIHATGRCSSETSSKCKQCNII